MILKTISAKRVCLHPLHPYASAYQHTTNTYPSGKAVSHAFAKELLAGFVGGELDKLAETKGRDAFDHAQASRHAKESAEQMYDQHYIDNHGASQYDPNQYGRRY
jgi:hypothetical protein